jgi:hypothetical protein
MSKLSTLADSLVGSEIVKLGNEINARKSKGEHILIPRFSLSQKP